MHIVRLGSSLLPASNIINLAQAEQSQIVWKTGCSGQKSISETGKESESYYTDCHI